MKSVFYLHISIISFFCFFFLTIFIINGNQLFFDMPIYNFFNNFSMTAFFKFITDFGNVPFLCFFLFLTFFIFKEKKNFKFLLVMMLFEVFANILLKNFFCRPRPTICWLIDETGFSFPSGHMMASTMFYGLCSYFLCSSNCKKILKIIGTGFFFLLIFTIGVSRVYLGVHYASDILGGFLVSMCIMCFGIFFFQNMHNKR